MTTAPDDAPRGATNLGDDVTAGTIGPVIDLRDGPTTRVRFARDDNPFTALAPPERMRLIIRVLCELVAYDEVGAADERRRTIRAAMDAETNPVGGAAPADEPAPRSPRPSRTG